MGQNWVSLAADAVGQVMRFRCTENETGEEKVNVTIGADVAGGQNNCARVQVDTVAGRNYSFFATLMSALGVNAAATWVDAGGTLTLVFVPADEGVEKFIGGANAATVGDVPDEPAFCIVEVTPTPGKGGGVITPTAFPPFPANPLDINAWIHWLGDVLKWVLDNLAAALSPLLKPFVDLLWSLLPPWIRDAWKSTEKWFADVLDHLDFSGIQKALEDLTNFFKDPLSIFQPAIDYVAVLSGHKISEHSERFATRDFTPPAAPSTSVPWPWGGLVDAFQATIGNFAETAKRTAATIQQTLTPGTEDWVKEYRAAVGPFAVDLGKQMQEATDISKFAKSPMTPEEAAKAATTLATLGLGIAVPTWIGHTLVKGATFGQFWAIKHAWEMLVIDMGYGGIFQNVVRAPADVGIIEPAKHWYRSLFRTTLPPAMLADRMRFWGRLKVEDWEQLYKFYGWTDEHRKAWEASMWSTPSERLFLRLMDKPLGVEPHARRWLKRRGYQDEEVDVIIGLFVKLSLQDEVKKLEDQALKDFVDGWIPVEQFEASMEVLGKTQDELKLIVQAGKEASSREIRDRQVKLFRSQFVRREISEAELESKLLELGLQKDRLALEVDLARAELKPEDPRLLTLDQLRDLYVNNKLDRARYKLELEKRKIQPDDAELTVLDADDRRFRDERSALATQALDDYLVLHADSARIRADLTLLNYSAEEISLRIARAEDQYSRTLAKQYLDIYTRGFETDKLTLDEFNAALASITPEISNRRKKDIIALAQARKKPAEAFGG